MTIWTLVVITLHFSQCQDAKPQYREFATKASCVEVAEQLNSYKTTTFDEKKMYDAFCVKK